MAKEVNLKNLVSVYGSGLSAPLLQSNDVKLIQIRNQQGNLIALFYRFSNSTWGFSTVGDSDWEDHKKNLEIDDSAV